MNDLSPQDIQLRRQAKKRVEMKLGFLTHLLVFVCVNGGLFVLGSLHGDFGGLHRLPLWGWGLGLAIHGLVTLLSLQGTDLRERMLQAEMRALRERA
ncbi:2TM domain-containing protein [Inhella sp.]|uniref:2TM domain-containing protein n=1 Tax=Inhella sp. TaxID=1921806 RepID=UPI0035AF4AAD